jgi:hypothetical protein
MCDLEYGIESAHSIDRWHSNKLEGKLNIGADRINLSGESRDIKEQRNRGPVVVHADMSKDATRGCKIDAR